VYWIWLIDKDGGDRGCLEGDSVDEVLGELNRLDGSDAMDRGCTWLGAYDITDEQGNEIELEFDGERYHVAG
jgi:hypothetical protein